MMGDSVDEIKFTTPLSPIWYFGYGSNTKSSVMRSRKIEPLAVRSVKVPGFTLTFDVFGLPYSEPAMASIARYTAQDATDSNPIPDVHGVAYLLSAADMRRLISTEGGGVAYNRILVEGLPCNGSGEPIKMQTLVARYPRRPNAAPSVRYLKLIKEGAYENAMPPEYIAYLESLPAFTPGTSWASRAGASCFLWVGRKIVRRLTILVKRALDENGECPKWYGSLIWILYSSMWFWHDKVHAVVFGRGDGGGVGYKGIRLE